MPYPVETLQDTDIFSRLVFDPRDLEVEGGPLSLKKSLTFNSSQQYKESVNCQRFATPFPERLHELGYRQANTRSQRRIAEGKSPFEYGGYFDVTALHIAEVKSEDHQFSVAHTPSDEASNDNIAHCDIRLEFVGSKPKPAIRALVIQLLCDRFSPLRAPIISATPVNDAV